MFADIDFMKLQRKLKENPQYAVSLYVCSHVFDAELSELKLDSDGSLINEKASPDVRMSSKELAAWIES